MNEQQIQQRINEMDAKLDKIYKSTERTRKYILAMLITSLVVVVLPLFGLIFVIPQFLSIYTNMGSNLGL